MTQVWGVRDIRGRDLDWRDDAACADMDPIIFFPELCQSNQMNQARINRAAQVCAGCHCRVECLRMALGDDKSEGVWGGFHFDAPDNTRKRARRARAVVAAREWLAEKTGDNVLTRHLA